MRNSTSYKTTTDARNVHTRTNARRDSRPLGMREVASVFERLMMRPGKWVSLAAQAEGATRWGQGTRRVYGSVHCYDDALVLVDKLKAEVEKKGSRFTIETRDGAGTLEVRVNFLDKRRR